ncbi:MAG: stage II sporulation protein P, partial [Oscillospiraceae bacterium]
MSIKKGIAVTALIIFGIYAVQTVGTDQHARDLISRLAGESGLSQIGEKPETTSSGGDKTVQTNSELTSETLPPFPSEVEIPETEYPEPEESAAILPTTIEGGMVISNETSYELDLGSLASAGTSVKLAPEGPQILIIHTHGSEAYTPDNTDSYEASDTFRTQDTEHSVIRVGDELASCFESYGLSVIHDRSIYDYPSYTGSYAKSQAAVESYL